MKNWLTIAAVALLAGAAGFTFYNLRNPASDGDSASTTSLATSVMSDVQAANAPKPVATVLPEFSLQNREGVKQSIRSWPGKSMIVNFWATWCAPCRKEIPLLKDIAKNEAKAGFQVVGIAIDFRDDVIKFADEYKIDYPLLMGEQDGLAAADSFGVQSAALPFTVFTDNQGLIVTMVVGELTPETARAAIATQMLKIPAEKH